MFFEPVGSHSPVRRLNLPTFHSCGMFLPTATLLRLEVMPQRGTSAVIFLAPSTASVARATPLATRFPMTSKLKIRNFIAYYLEVRRKLEIVQLGVTTML